MRTRTRPGYGLFQLLVVIAVIAILIGLLLPAVQKVREAAARTQAANNLKQLALACHNHNDTFAKLPAGVDGKNFSALFHLLPFIEQDNLYKRADKDKDCDDKANADIANARVKTFLSPADAVGAEAGGTNYFAVAGSKEPLKGNNGAFFRDSTTAIPGGFQDGTSNTAIFVEMLRGDGVKRAVSVQRQHVRLKEGALQGLDDTAGVKDWKANKNVAANRGAAWIDGRFLQATTNATRGMDDAKPDVDCGGAGGLAGVRMVYSAGTNVALADGSVRLISRGLSLTTWQAATTTSGGEVLGSDW